MPLVVICYEQTSIATENTDEFVPLPSFAEIWVLRRRVDHITIIRHLLKDETDFGASGERRRRKVAQRTLLITSAFLQVCTRTSTL